MMDEYEASLPPRSERNNSKNKNNQKSFFDELMSTIKYIISTLIIFFIVISSLRFNQTSVIIKICIKQLFFTHNNR